MYFLLLEAVDIIRLKQALSVLKTNWRNNVTQFKHICRMFNNLIGKLNNFLKTVFCVSIFNWCEKQFEIVTIRLSDLTEHQNFIHYNRSSIETIQVWCLSFRCSDHNQWRCYGFVIQIIPSSRYFNWFPLWIIKF